MKYLILLIIGLISFIELSAQQVQATIKKDNSSSNNCVNIYAKSNSAINSPPSNYLMTISIADQTSNPNIIVSNLLPGMILDVNNPSPYTSNGRHYYDNNIVQDGNPPDLNWTADTEYLIGKICFENGEEVNELIQINDLNSGGNNFFSYWYFELQGPGDVTNYTEKFYDDGGVTSTSYNGSDSYAQTTQSVTLPINIFSFIATKFNSTSSYLSWTSMNEVNFDKFELERRIDSRNWLKIGEVAGYALSKTNDYSYIDKDVYGGNGEQTFYYRLKMIDKDGGWRYSKVENVIFSPSEKDMELTLYPNPSSEKVYFTLSGIEEGSSVNITIFDNTGKMAYHKDMERLSKRNLLLDNYRLNIKSGVYNVLINDNNGNRFYKKLIITK